MKGLTALKQAISMKAGFNFSATALRDGSRLISVIMGIHTDSYYQGLLNNGRMNPLLCWITVLTTTVCCRWRLPCCLKCGSGWEVKKLLRRKCPNPKGPF